MCFRHNWFDEPMGLMSAESIEKIYEIIQKGTFDTVFFGNGKSQTYIFLLLPL